MFHSLQFSKRIPCPGIKNIPKLHKKAVNICYYFGAYGPDWYQELSDRQMAAADALTVSLTEDSEQGTVYRTQLCLRCLGIYPLPTGQQIREAMAVSRRNDIAFLWVLMEMNFVLPQRKNKKRRYSLNERHILSTICHLDMITTLRGLDETISLPPNKPTKLTTKTRPKRKKAPTVYESPYLEPQMRPSIPISKALPIIPLPDPCFPPYEAYRDKSFVVENEPSRFYGTNKEQTACGCSAVSKDLILQQYCPTNHTTEEHEEYAERLFDNFVRATYCYCLGDHKMTNSTSDTDIVYYVQLEQAKTNNEFIAILKTYIGQVVVGHIMKQLLFGESKDITNIFACVNCETCGKDYERLKKLAQQQNSMQRSIKPYEARILFSVFGSEGPAGLLKTFNDIAKDREQIVHACVKDVWKTELYLWSDSQSNPTDVDELMSCDFKSKEVDPRDSQLMDDMLSKALQALQKDSKYVIPHLPQANKIPLLNQWIRVRYGIKYSRNERAAMLRNSVRQWRFLDRKGKHSTPVPMPNDVCHNSRYLHQGHRKNVDKCITALKEAYSYRVGMALINDGRRFWPTMEPYLCSQGPPRSLYYAYMPSSIYDLTLIKPWALNEFKDMVRQMAKNAAAACSN